MRYFKKPWIDYLGIGDGFFYWTNIILYPYLLLLLIIGIVQIILDYICSEVSFTITFYSTESKTLVECEQILTNFDTWERRMNQAGKKIKQYNYRYIYKIKQRKFHLEQKEDKFELYMHKHGNISVKARLLNQSSLLGDSSIYEAVQSDGYVVFKPRDEFENDWTKVN